MPAGTSEKSAKTKRQKEVIASDLGGMTELVAHQERGLLVPHGDVDALTRAMLWMHTHVEAAKEMGENARAYALKEHSAKVHYKRIMDIYKKLIRP